VSPCPLAVSNDQHYANTKSSFPYSFWLGFAKQLRRQPALGGRRWQRCNSCVKYRAAEATQAYNLTILDKLEKKRKPVRDPHEIEKWRAQHTEVLERYEMLVLHGRSQTGKTMWARIAFGDRKYCYEVNCSVGDEPDVRNFDLVSQVDYARRGEANADNTQREILPGTID